MTGYFETRKKAASMPRAEQDAYAMRVLDRRRAVWRAGSPWTWLGLAAWALAFAAVAVPAALKFEDAGGWFLVALGCFAAGMVLDRRAASKKRAYERAHPFEG